MKKLFTLLTLLLCVVVGTKAQTASDVYLDLNNYATIDEAGGITTSNNATGLYAYDDETNWLTVSAWVAVSSKTKQTWISSDNTNSGSDSWSATDVFKGNGSYFSSGARELSITSSNTAKFRVSSCTEVRALVKARGKSRTITLDVYKINSDGTEIAKLNSATTSAQSNTVIKVESLNPSEIYEARVYSSTGSNDFLYEVAFKAEIDSRTATSVAFAETSGTGNLGEAFNLPTLTTDPNGLAVTYESSNTDVAEVNATTGAVTLKAVGKTTITATFAGNATYRNSSASYTLTVVDPNAKTVTATFPFNTGAAGQIATVSDDGVFSVTSVGVADMTYIGVGSDQGVTGTKMQPASKASDNKSQYTKFNITPKKGITFIPKKVSFDALRWGTDGSNKLHYYAECGSTSVELGNVNPNRNGKGLGWSHYEHNLSDIQATSENPFSLACYVYGLAADKQISFANIVIEGEYSGVAEEETMYAITTSVTPAGAGNVIQNPAGASLTEGTTVEFSATANTGYMFLNKWTVNGAEVDGATYNVASLSEDLNVEAQFKKLYSISFNAGEGDKGTSNPLPTVYAETTYTTPAANYYISKAGYTATGWTDGVNEYEFGEVITLTGDITLTPIFTANTKTIADTGIENVTITYGFNNSSSDPAINLENSTGYYIKTATFGGETIDVPMFIDNRDNAGIDGKRGKTNNVGRSNAQINTGAKFTIPAVAGMTVTINKANGSFEGTTIAGDPYTDTYTYTGSAESIDIIFTSDGLYINSVVVTYPKTHTYVDVTDAGYRTFASSSALDFTKSIEGLKAYKATVDGKTVKFETIDCAVPASTGMLLKAAEGRYYIPLASGTPAVLSDNKLVGVLEETNVEDGIFVLMNGGASGVGFYKTENTFTVGANTAYLPANVVTGARQFIGFDEEGEATGIEAIERNQMKDSFYNLNGQRVAAPQKGLYIVNGKKVVLK